jgi:hypothetical protein
VEADHGREAAGPTHCRRGYLSVPRLAQEGNTGATPAKRGRGEPGLLVETLDPDFALGLDPTEVSQANLDLADDPFFEASELLAGEQRVEHRDDSGVAISEMNLRA